MKAVDMDLKVMLPTRVLVEQVVVKIIAEAYNGSFCLLPRHIDFVAALVPGVLYFTDEHGHEHYLALDQGVLVKIGRTVLVSAFDGVRGEQLETLKDTVQKRFRELDERERMARTALARLEAGTLRRFLRVQERGGG